MPQEAPSRLILTLMAFTVVFAVIGKEIEGSKPAPTGKPLPSWSPFTIIFGGTVATVLLSLLSKVEAAEEFATGLALIAFLSSMLVYGGEVFGTLTNALGYKPTTLHTTPTTPTPIPVA